MAFITLQYAENTLIFGQYNVRQATVFRWILRYFEKWSELKINFHKSSLLLIEQISLSLMIVQHR